MNKDVVEKCLAFCQALSSNNKLFSFSLKIGSDNFNFELKELAKSSCIKKKKSPSQLRREMRRREERERAATKAKEDTAEQSEKSVVVKPKCDPCDSTFNSEEELSAHIENVHKVLPSPEKERGIVPLCDLQLSPIHGQRDEEKPFEQEGAASSPAPGAGESKSVLKRAGRPCEMCLKEDGYFMYPFETESLCGPCYWSKPDRRRREKERNR